MLKEATRPVWSLNEFDKTLVTATYFGFMPIMAPKVTDADIEAAKHCIPHPHFDAVEKAALIRHYNEHNFASLPHPLALAYCLGGGKRRTQGYSLHFIGAQTGIAEATLIRTALSILADEGYENLHVDINCIGDKDSFYAYERELINYVKKFGADMSESLRQSLKQDIFNLFKHDEEEAARLRSTAPSSINFLSSLSRLHFKEVLEYLESLGIDFRLTPELIGEKNHSSHTIFAIKGIGSSNSKEGNESTLAVGYRYSRLGKKMGFRKEVPMAGVTLFSQDQQVEKKVYKQLPKPKFYLIQLGRDAKMKTLSLIELLRSHKIPVHHFLGKDKLAVQLSNAENLRVTYLIIIGQKEAIDGTATIRNMSTRAQDTISVEMLPDYLKNIAL
ncbi:MAG: His/Gly/Thr/Pro-type tRNA ligase C-terminal domain-containing protein [Candidatus Zambryskibacteria bacterium]|nr:His/Gly/Thr/Pro-type tRNA ligase C-terminal domain-containing protein [Candidatus Zambryskibacteria bacterium]